MGSVVLDTNIVIYFLDGKLLNPLPTGDILVSVITEIELLGFHGLTPESESAILSLLRLANCIGIDDSVKEEAIRIRRSNRLRLADAIIAATAIVSNAILLTLDSNLLSLPGLNVSAPKLLT